MSKLDQLKTCSRKAREERDRICAARLARRIAAARRRDERRYRANRSPFRSEWTLQQVLRRLSFPDLPGGSSHELMQMLSDAIDEAVDRVTSRSDVDVASESESEREMRRFAADLVESVVTKVRNEIYPAYLRLLGTGREDETEDLYDEMYDQGEFEQSDTGSDEELNFSAPTSDDASGERGSRSVRFSFDEAIIPVSMDSLDVLGASGLKPVSEHMLTPVPSPLPYDGASSDFDFRVKGPSKPTKQESRLVESLLLRLLDDLNHGRLKRGELLKLTGYCIEVVKAREVPGEKDGKDAADQEARESPSGQVADDLVKFTLSRILDDIKSGSISQEDLTSLTHTLVKDVHDESGIEADVADDDLDRLISSALSGAMEDDQDVDEEQVSDWMLEDFVSRTLSQVKDDMGDNKLTEEELKEMGSAIVSAVFDDVAQDESLMAEEIMKKTLHDVLEDVEADRLVGAVMDKVVTAIVSSYHTLTRQEKSSTELIEDFVTDVLTQVVDGIKAGEYSEHELKQIISAKRSLLADKTASHQGELDTKHRVQTLIDSLLSQIEAGALSEGEMLDIGNVLVDTGRKLLSTRGVPSTSTADIEPEQMTSTEIAERVVKEVIENIQGEMEDEEFEKEALKALAASFLKVRSSSLEGFSNVPTIGSSRDLSYLSTMKPPSPTDSSLAADVVLAAMDRITRDITERNIPVHMLSSIALSLAPDSEDMSVFISEDGLGTVQSSSLPQNLRSTLLDITQLLRNDRIRYADAKRIFTTILQSYLSGERCQRLSSIDLTEEDSRMIEDLISETLNSVVRNVTADVSSMSVPIATGKSDLSIARLSSVVSEGDLEKLVWDTLHRIGQGASMESVISRPAAPIQFKSHSSVASQNIESLVRETLVQVAHDISEGIASDSSLVDAKHDISKALSSRTFSSKVIAFVNSVLEELIVGLERGTVSKASIAQFMCDICPGQDFKNMEVENLHRHLLRVMEDVMHKKTAFVYFGAIADKFSSIKEHGDKRRVAITPEMQMIGNIVSNVDANILTQFVQATLLAVLGGVQTSGTMADEMKEGGITSLLRVESSVIARKVIDDLIARIEKEVTDGTVTFDETVRKDSSDLANIYVDDLICQLHREVESGDLKPGDKRKPKQAVQAQEASSAAKVTSTPVHTREPSQTAVTGTTKSMSGKFSAYVLETLKAVVSDLRAHGPVSETGLFSDSDTASRRSSSLLDDFIYKQLQQAVESIQNLPPVAAKSSESKKPSVASSEETPPATREVSGLIGNVLNEVVADMIVEKVAESLAVTVKEDEIVEPKPVDSVQDVTPITSKSKSKSFHEEAQGVVSVTVVSSTEKTKSIQDIIPATSKSKSKSFHEDGQDDVPVSVASSTEIAKLVLATLRHVLSSETCSYSSLIDRESSKESSGTESDQNKDSAPKVSKIKVVEDSSSSTPAVTEPKQDSSVGVSELVAEVINQTIMNIKDGKLSQVEMSSLAGTLAGPRKSSGNLENFMLGILEGVKGDILRGGVSTDNIENVAQQLATLSVDKKDGSIKKQPSKVKAEVKTESNTSVQSMVKEVLSHIVVSLSDEARQTKESTTDEAGETNVRTPSTADVPNKNDNTYVPTPTPGMANASPDVISNLANMSIRDSPASLPTSRMSDRNVVQHDGHDRVSTSKTSIGSCSIADSKGSDLSVDGGVTVIPKQSSLQKVASSKSTTPVKKKSSKHQQSDVSVSSVDSSAIENFVRECLPKDAASLKSSSSDLKQKGQRKPRTSDAAVTSKKSSTVTVSKTRDVGKKTDSKSSIPAIHVDSCSTISNTSSRTRMSSSSSSYTSSSCSSKQDVRSKKSSKKQDAKDIPDVKVTEACGDAVSTGSETSQCSSQQDVTQIRSVCGSHTTQVRVRDSQSESSKE